LPAPGISIREFAKRSGLDDKQVRRGISAGRLTKLSDGTLDPLLVGTEWRRPVRPRADTEQNVRASVSAITRGAETPSQAAERIITTGGASHALAEAERIKENYLALLRQLEYDTKSGAVVRVDRVAKIFGDACARVRTRMLAIPAEIAPELHRKKTVAEIVDELRRAINEALEELTSGGDSTGDIG
jgi:hypothetical protein